MCKTPVLAHFGAYDVEKVSDRKDRKVNTRSVNESISQLVNQPASQLVSLSISQFSRNNQLTS